MSNYTIQGKIYWAKIFGEPQDNFQKTKKQWSFDLGLDANTMSFFKNLKTLNKIKNKADDRGFFTSFSRPEFNGSTGKKNNPIPVYAVNGDAWDINTKLGNGTLVEVEFGLVDVQARDDFPGGKKVVPYRIKILELVVFHKQEKPSATETESYA